MLDLLLLITCIVEINFNILVTGFDVISPLWCRLLAINEGGYFNFSYEENTTNTR